ncbi:MAG: trypsin-like peptidase domain-containing protein [Burkholderiales bacterium]|nr:trypsin-like peptidase domain-containing protein [Burkholderiales bacterium]
MKKRAPLYSSSTRARPDGPATEPPASETGAPASAAPVAESGPASPPGVALRRRLSRGRALLLAAGGAAILLLAFAQVTRTTAPREITQQDIDAAVLRTLETQPLPSRTAKAYEVIRPSVVRVRGLTSKKPDDEAKADGKPKPDDKRGDRKDPKEPRAERRPNKGADKGASRAPAESDEIEQGVGSGVVIVDKGIILTNLHVVAGAERVKVVFADGMESDADVIGLRPEHDLAVLQARTVPDDLVPATMRSTHDLAPGDEVVAVGFPFGIGPSVSSGVVSGLRREFRSEEGKRVLTNLIQFDAAANPGSSGGPLVTLDGAVVGIVTAILNPTEQRVFIGIGFAVPIENAASAAGMPPF